MGSATVTSERTSRQKRRDARALCGSTGGHLIDYDRKLEEGRRCIVCTIACERTDPSASFEFVHSHEGTWRLGHGGRYAKKITALEEKLKRRSNRELADYLVLSR